MASAKLNEASLEKKLYHAEPTQQGIQGLPWFFLLGAFVSWELEQEKE